MGKGRHPRARQTNNWRKTSFRRVQERILIVCEGTATEPNYFGEIKRKFKLPTVITHANSGTAPIQVAEDAWARFLSSGKQFDVLYAVFDRDEHASYNQALNFIAEKHSSLFKNDERKPTKFFAIRSLPCFELWLLLHFRDVYPAISKLDVFRLLNTEYVDYAKGAKNVFAYTENRIRDAIRRVERVNAKTESDGDTAPHTDIHTLVKHLYSLGGESLD